MAYKNGMAVATNPKIVKPKKAGAQKFDPTAFAKMRGDIKQRQEQQARIAARVPAPAPAPVKPDAMKLSEKEVFGLNSRKKMANRMQKGMK